MNLEIAFLLLFQTTGLPIYLGLGSILGVLAMYIIGRYIFRAGEDSFSD